MGERLDRYFDYLSNNVDKLLILFVAEFLGLLVLLPSFLVVERGTATFVVLVLDLVGLVGLMTFTGVLVLKCYRIV